LLKTENLSKTGSSFPKTFSIQFNFPAPLHNGQIFVDTGPG
jgi:hypothetical protein